MIVDSPTPFTERLRPHLEVIYPDHDSAVLARRISEIFLEARPTVETALWSSADSLLITYGDTIGNATGDGSSALETLDGFLERHVGDAISSVHILPFCPFSSDDGFSVIDFHAVNPDLGSWDDIVSIAERYRLMADLVINHASAESEWFANYLKNQDPGRDYFVESSPEEDLSQVVRPRSSPLLREVTTAAGTRHVWCTFSHDQVDLNFRNPMVLLEMLRVVRRYLDHGVQIIRLDAIGYLWKEVGRSCIHEPETHEAVRLLRTIVDEVAPGTILITETNVPNHENLSYFGNCNEAHVIYNFSLAPLLLNALLTGESVHLRTWMMSMPPAPVGCTYLNFTASHDGIGMRPAEGLLTEDEQARMTQAVVDAGGRVSKRRMSDGSERVYELNISLFDALQGTINGPDEYQVERFLCSQTVMMGLEGIPAFYIHSLLATPNDLEGVAATGHNRAINRYRWDLETLESLLAVESSPQHRVMHELLRRIRIRAQQPAFDPAATQFTLQLETQFFGFWRQSTDRQQSIFAIHNLSDREQLLPLQQINLISTDDWTDLLSGEPVRTLRDVMTIRPYRCLWITNRP